MASRTSSVSPQSPDKIPASPEAAQPDNGEAGGTKPDFAKAKAEITAISIVTALCLCGDSFLYVALPLHWEAAGLATLFEVGVVLSANRLVRIPLNPAIALFYNRFSCRAGLLLATLLAIVSTAGYGLCQGLFAWLVLRAVWGLSWTLLRLGTLFSILSVSTPATLGHLTGVNNGLYRLGSLGGMLLGGLLADSFGLRTAALLFAGVSCLAPFVLLRTVPKEERSSRPTGAADAPGTASAGSRDAEGKKADWKAVFRADRSTFFWVMATAFLVAMTYQGLTASTISMLLDSHSHEKLAVLGFTLSAATLSGCLQSLRWVWEPFLAPFFGRLSDGRLGRCRLSALAFSLAAVTLVAGAQEMGLAPLCLAILLVLLAATLLTTATDALGNDAALLSANPRAYLSAFALFTDLGAAAGPLFAYMVIALAGTEPAWLVTAAFLLVFAVHWWTHPRLPGSERREASAV